MLKTLKVCSHWASRVYVCVFKNNGTNDKPPFTLSIIVNTAMLLVILFWLNCLDFLIKQVSDSKNGLQPQFTRYDKRWHLKLQIHHGDLLQTGLHRTQAQRIGFKHVLCIKFNATIDIMLSLKQTHSRGLCEWTWKAHKKWNPNFL